MSLSHPADVASAARRWIVALAVVAFGTSTGLAVPGVHAQDEGPARLDLTTSSAAAKQHFWAGMNDAANVFPQGAARHFEMALEADPGLGLAMVMHGFTNPAFTNEQTTARIAEGVAAMGNVSANERLVALAFQTWASPGGAPAASRMFDAASQLMPGDPYLATYATQLAGARGDRTDVITRWQAVVEAFPELANPHNTIAYQQFARRNEGAALTSVRRYVEMAPNHPNAADSYAEILQWTGRYPEAMAEYTRATELDAGFDAAYMGGAEVLALVGAWDQSATWIGRGIEHARNPNVRAADMRALGNIHMIAGNRDGAMGALQQASAEAAGADLSGPQALAHEQMALTNAVLGDGRFVAEYLGEAAAVRGSEVPLHLALAGLAYAASNDGVMAREASGKLAATENAFMNDMGRAINALVLLREDQAQAALDELMSANPGDPVVQAVMADAYDRLDRPGAAAALRSRVVGNPQINLANPFWAFAVAHVRSQ